jgi:Cof subfamily protein (haloacid dehalogenase superfamily)
MKYDGIVIYSDLDGTLLDPQRRLSPENVKAISYFVEEGGRFGVATGRMEQTTRLKFPELPINIPSIFFNGALIYDTHKDQRLKGQFLPQGLPPLFQKILDHYPDIGLEINTPGRAYILRSHEIIGIQLAREGLTGIEACWEEVPPDWYKVIFVGDHETLVKVKAEVDSLNRTDITIMFSETELLDVMARDVSKGKALAQLMEAHKEWRTVFAVGDNDNDYEMIQKAHVGIAVANARPSLKEAAQHVIDHHSVPCMPQVLKIIDTYLSTGR